MFLSKLNRYSIFANQTRLCSNKFLYDIIGINPSCGKSELKKAYHERCKQYHPDLNKDEKYSSKFLEVQRAYSLLSNNEERLRHDTMKGKEAEIFIRNWKREFSANNPKPISSPPTKNYGSTINSLVSSWTGFFRNKKELQLSIEDNKYENTNFLYFVLDGSASMATIPHSEFDRLGIPVNFIRKERRDGATYDIVHWDSKYDQKVDSGLYISKCLNSMSNLVNNIGTAPVPYNYSLRVFSEREILLRENFPISSFNHLMSTDNKLCRLEEEETRMYDAIKNSINHQIRVGSISRTTFVVLTDGIDTSSDCSLDQLISFIKHLRTIKIILIAINLDNINNLNKIARAALFGKVYEVGQMVNLSDLDDKFTQVRNDILRLEASKNIVL